MTQINMDETARPPTVLTDALVDAALRTFLKQADAGRKLDWYLLSAPSAERWLQFEFAFYLQQRLIGNYVVCCERKYRDIVIVRPTAEPIWEREHVAAIELKLFGNWYCNAAAAATITADVEKVRKFSDEGVPSMALVLWLSAANCQTSPCYEWLNAPVTKLDLLDANAIQLKMSEVDPAFRKISDIECKSSEVKGLRLLAFACS